MLRQVLASPVMALVAGALASWCLVAIPARPADALDVYIMSSGDATTDTAVQTALVSRGHTPTLGVQLCAWDGTQATLGDFDAVVLLNSHNWASCGSMPEAGVDALLAYVSGGGGVVTSEWLIWNMDAASKHTGLEPMIPADGGPFNTAASTTYSLVTADPVLACGLPVSFQFSLNNLSGSESDLTAKAGASVYYGSSNGGGAGGGNAGVVGWSYGAGRVMSYSTFLSSVELASADYARLFVNSVVWAASATIESCATLDHFLTYQINSSKGHICTADAPQAAGGPCTAEEDCGGVADETAFCVPNKFPKGVQISLADALLREHIFDVKKPVSLGNPADKNGSGISDTQTHLKGYQVTLAKATPRQTFAPTSNLTILNQFHPARGPLQIDTQKPDRLLVPTAKCLDSAEAPCPAPVPLPDPAHHIVDHFRCDTVKVSRGTKFTPILGVAVDDQFAGGAKLFDLSKPTRLCIPVEKTILPDGKAEPVQHPERLLMCYQAKLVRGQPKHAKIASVHVNNQFGPELVDTLKEEELCVPSTIAP